MTRQIVFIESYLTRAETVRLNSIYGCFVTDIVYLCGWLLSYIWGPSQYLITCFILRSDNIVRKIVKMIALKFYWYLGTAELPVKFQSDWTVIDRNHVIRFLNWYWNGPQISKWQYLMPKLAFTGKAFRTNYLWNPKNVVISNEW